MKIFFYTLLIFGTLFTAVVVADAQTYQTDLQKQTEAFAGNQGASFGTPRDPRVVVGYVIQILLTLVGTVFLGYTVYAGYLIMTARGDDERVTKGKETLQTAIIGIVIILSAYSITLLATKIVSRGKTLNQDTMNKQQGDGIQIHIGEDPNDFLQEDPFGPGAPER